MPRVMLRLVPCLEKYEIFMYKNCKIVHLDFMIEKEINIRTGMPSYAVCADV